MIVGKNMFGLNIQEKKGLKIIIVGCGKIGTTLVDQLSKEGHDITLIDKDSKRIAELSETYDCMGITGNGASFGVLNEAGVADADLLIAVTESDELNLLCCTVAKRQGKCSAIARVRTPEYSDESGYLREKLGLAMIINPEREAATEIARLLFLPTALEIDTFAHGLAEMIKIKIPDGNILDGKPISQIIMNGSNRVLICAIERDKDVFIPSGAFVLKSGDNISLVAPRNNVREFLKSIGFDTKQVRDCMIVGGGRSAYYLSRQLVNMGIDVKIIEKDIKRCDELSELLPTVSIFNGDGTEESTLREQGIHDIDSFVAMTGIDEENVILGLYAQNSSSAKTITKINRITFNDVLSKLSLGSVIYPRSIAAETIVTYVRAKLNSKEDNNIEALYHLFDDRVEAMEFKVTTESEVTGVPIKELKLKRNLLISVIVRDGKVFIPWGSDELKVGDSVVVVTSNMGFKELSDIIEAE